MEQVCRDRDEPGLERSERIATGRRPSLPGRGVSDEGLICSADRVCRGDAGTACVDHSQCYAAWSAATGCPGGARPGEALRTGLPPARIAHRSCHRGTLRRRCGGRERVFGSDGDGARLLRGSRPRLRESQALADESPSVCIYPASSIPAGKDTRQYAAQGVRPGMLRVERGAVECCPCVPPAGIVFLQGGGFALGARRGAGGRSASVDAGVGKDELAAGENGQWWPSTSVRHEADREGGGSGGDPSRGAADDEESGFGGADQESNDDAPRKVDSAGERRVWRGDFALVRPDCCACPLPGADRTLRAKVTRYTSFVFILDTCIFFFVFFLLYAELAHGNAHAIALALSARTLQVVVAETHTHTHGCMDARTLTHGRTDARTRTDAHIHTQGDRQAGKQTQQTQQTEARTSLSP